MDDLINIYNAHQPLVDKSSYKKAKIINSRSKSINNDNNIDYESMNGPSMMAIDRAINRSNRRMQKPKKMNYHGG
jgi:hypothetical protein